MDTFLIPIIIKIVVIPFIVSLMFYKYLRMYLWYVPLIAIVITCAMFFFNDIRFVNGETFNDKLNMYFHTDWCLNFYLLYIPIIISSIIFTVIFYLVGYFKRR